MRSARAALVAGTVAVLLVGCTPTVALTPAPQATSRACAAVAVRLPQTIAGAARRATDAQGTAAWGDNPAITLVCGVTRTPSSDCGTVDDIDWTSKNTVIDGRRVVVLTTFGRQPTIRVVNPATRQPAVPTADVLLAVNDAVREGTRATGERCGAGGPTTAATPSARSTITHGPGPG